MKIRPFIIVLFTLGLFYFYYSIFTFEGIQFFKEPVVLVIKEKTTDSTKIIAPISTTKDPIGITKSYSTRHYQDKETKDIFLQLNTRYGSFIWFF